MDIKLNYWVKYRETDKYIYLRHIIDDLTEIFISVKIDKSQPPVLIDGLYLYRDLYTNNGLGFDKDTKTKIWENLSDCNKPYTGVYQILLPFTQNYYLNITHSYIKIETVIKINKIHYTAKWGIQSPDEQYNLIDSLLCQLDDNNADTLLTTILQNWIDNHPLPDE